MTIEELRKSGLIAYEYVRGSTLYGLNVEGKSDIDIGGVFICPQDTLYGVRANYAEYVSDEKGDTVFYELGRWIELLLKSNPNALESLFIPKSRVIGKIHPVIKDIIEHRDMFLSKTCFNAAYGYAVSQIEKARGLNKKIVNPIVERKDILDFCYTFDGQGSIPMKEFLSANYLDQKYCGLVNIPHMDGFYGVYYDFAAYFKFEKIDWKKAYYNRTSPYIKFLPQASQALSINNKIANENFFGYSGILYPNDIAKSNDVRLSSVPKGETPICHMYYNKNGYETHCREYKEYKEWEDKRNPERYESNLGHNYDSKNMMHCMRLIKMSKELAQGKGFNVVRKKDKQYLMDIRNHKFEYEDLIAQVEKEKAEMEAAIKESTLPDTVDFDAVNEMLINARKAIYQTV